MNWDLSPGASLADLATIELRRITDVLQVDHASLFLRDADDPEHTIAVAEAGLPSGEALPERCLLLEQVLRDGARRAGRALRGPRRGLLRRAGEPARPRRPRRRRAARRHPASEPAAGRDRLRGRPPGDPDARGALHRPGRSPRAATASRTASRAPRARGARPAAVASWRASIQSTGGQAPALLEGSMATTAEHVERRPTDGFRHEALLYAGDDGFLEGTLPVAPRRGRGAASRSSSSSAPPGSPACARSSEPRPRA